MCVCLLLPIPSSWIKINMKREVEFFFFFCAHFLLLGMTDCFEVGFPISATAEATTADGTAFVIAVGGGGASRTGVKNGYVICKASSSLFFWFFVFLSLL